MRLFFQLTIALAAIAQVSAEERKDTILIQGIEAGAQTVRTDKAGVTQVEYSYNDRGRGDHITATWKLDPAGVPTAYEGRGNDYMKAPVEERFQSKDGMASWKNRSEQGQQAVTGEAFYVPANPPPEFLGVLARALLKAPGHRLPLLPAGEATIEESGKLKVGEIELIQYRITGLGFTPQAIWLDQMETLRRMCRAGSRLCPLRITRPYRSCRKRNKLLTTCGRDVSRMRLPTSRKDNL